METAIVTPANTKVPEPTRSSLIIVDTQTEIVSLVRDECAREMIGFSQFATMTDALVFLSQRRVDVIMVRADSPDIDGVELLRRARRVFPDVTGILLTNGDERSVGVDAVSSGTAQYVLTNAAMEESLKNLLAKVARSHHEIRSQRLKKILGTFRNLPVPEKLQSKLRQMLSRADVPVHEIISEMDKNPALVAKVLRVANSVHYSTRTTVTSLREAVIFIGIEYLQTLVTAIDLFENIVKGARGDVRALYEAMWDSSMRKAMLAKRIAEESDYGVDSSTAHVVGLLQNIGLLVRLCTEPDSYIKMMELVQKEQTCMYAAELRVYASTHDELGAALLDRWNFPHEIIFAVANHHGESFGDGLTEIVQIADAVDEDGQREPHDEGLAGKIAEWRERLKDILAATQNTVANSARERENG